MTQSGKQQARFPKIAVNWKPWQAIPAAAAAVLVRLLLVIVAEFGFNRCGMTESLAQYARGLPARFPVQLNASLGNANNDRS
jgi:hypothetical protein